MDYIEEHLDENLSLNDLSAVACLSKYHFSRVFSAYTGESLYSFVTRLRLEKAAVLLSSHPSMSVTDAAGRTGFNDTATFSRAFRQHFKCSASSWKKYKKSQNSKNHQELFQQTGYNSRRPEGKVRPVSAVLESVPEIQLLYVRHTGPFAADPLLFQKLYCTLMERLESSQAEWDRTAGVLVVYHDALDITESPRLRITCGVCSAGSKRPEGLGVLKIQENTYLKCRFLLGNHEYGQAWTSVYRDILPDTGKQPADAYCYEQYFPDCYNSQTKKSEVIIAVPVKE